MSRKDSSTELRSGESASQPALRRELRFPETAAVSVGVMAPTLAMSVTGVAAAVELGRAAPLAFAVAALDISPANQRVLLHRARTVLREALAEYYRG